MGKQSSRIYFNAKDHKDIYFNGNFHKAMYLTDEKANAYLVWEKLAENKTFVFVLQDTMEVYEVGNVPSMVAGTIGFYISPLGEVTIDWGDGSVEKYTSYGFVTHTYPTNNKTKYNVKIDGYFTDLMTYKTTNSVHESALCQILTSIKVEKRLKNQTLPLFGYSKLLTEIPSNLFEEYRGLNISAYRTFGNTGITEIPEGLFDGIETLECIETFIDNPIINIPGKLFQNTDVSKMTRAFSGTNIIDIPSELFANGQNITDMQGTFSNTNILTIPSGLFDNCTEVINYSNCFEDCKNLISVNQDLFSNSKKAVAFDRTFKNNTGLIDVPQGLFDFNRFENSQKISFVETFYNCKNVTSIVPELWNRSDISTFNRCYYNCVNATNYNIIPDNWK